MLELQSTDSESKFFEGSSWESWTSLLFYDETICSHTSKSAPGKNAILFSREAGMMIDDVFPIAT